MSSWDGSHMSVPLFANNYSCCAACMSLVCQSQAKCSLFMFISGVYAVLVWKKV